MKPGRVAIISGPPGAGKSTAAREVVTMLERAVRLETDFFYAAIAAGYIEPWLPESHDQNMTVVTAAAKATATFAEAGYDVIVEGIVLPWALAVYEDELAPFGVTPSLVVLLPPVEVATKRGLARSIPPERAPDAPVYREMHRQFSALEGAWTLDTGRLSRFEVARAIMAACFDGSAG